MIILAAQTDRGRGIVRSVDAAHFQLVVSLGHAEGHGTCGMPTAHPRPGSYFVRLLDDMRAGVQDFVCPGSRPRRRRVPVWRGRSLEMTAAFDSELVAEGIVEEC